MRADEMVEVLGPWLSRVRRPGWRPIVEDGEGSAVVSKFCGLPWTGPEADWPACACCGGPLTLLVQLDLDALPEELGDRFGSGLLQLFYCLGDDCQGEGGWEPFADDLSRVRIVHPDGSDPSPPASADMPCLPAKRIVGWDRFDDLPGPEEHDECGLKSAYDFEAGTVRFECPEVGLDQTQPMSECEAEEIAVAQAGDKLAGWPAWVQGVEYPACPTCGGRMVLVFQVDSEDNVPFMWGDAGCGHVTQCPEHKEVVAFGCACS
jgi:uncharacterized protein YwqG